MNGKEAENTMNNLNKSIKQQEAAFRKLTAGTQEYIEKAEEIKKLKELQAAHNRELETAEKRTDRLRQSFLRLGAGLGGFTQVITTVKNSLNYLRDFATELAQLDDKMHLVRKTTNLTMKEIHSLNQEFMKIDTRTSREDLNELAYAAGKLGIDTKEGVLQFVESADRINVALGDVLGGTDAIIEITKMMEIYKKSTKEIAGDDLRDNLLKTGSVINELGKTSTANEKAMAGFLARLAGVSSQIGMSMDQAAGYASAVSQLELHVEMSSTALQRMFVEMFKKPAEYAKAAGMELEEFKKLMTDDFNEAALKVLEGFSKAGGLGPLSAAFKDMGLDGQRAITTMMSLANNIEKVREAQETANKAIKEGVSVDKEYQTMNESMQAEMEKARKAVQDSRVELGEKMYPAVIKVLGLRSKVIKWLAEMTQHTEKWVGAGLNAAVIAIAALLPKMKSMWERIKASKLAIDLKTLSMTKEKAAQLAGAAADRERELTAAKLNLQQKEQRVESLKLRNEYAKTAETARELARAEEELAAATAAVKTAETEAAVAARRNAEAQRLLQDKKNITFLSFVKNHWLLIAEAIIFATVKIVEFAKASKGSMEEFNKKVAEQQAEVKYLIDKMKKAEEGTDDYREALEELKEKYPDIIRMHINEKNALDDIKQAYEDIIEQIRTKTALELKQQKDTEATSETLEKQASALDIIREKLKKNKRTDVEIQDIMKMIREEVSAGKEPKDILQALDNRFKLKESEKRLLLHTANAGMHSAVPVESGELVYLVAREKELNEILKKNEDLYGRIAKDKEEELAIQDKIDELVRKRKFWDPKGQYGDIVPDDKSFKSRALNNIDAEIDKLLDRLTKVKAAKEELENAKKETENTNDTFNWLDGNGSEDKTLDKWKALLERISDLNRKYQIKETPMSKAKQQLEQEFSEMKDAVEDFYAEHPAYGKQGRRIVLELDKEMWRQIHRLDKEEREKALKDIDERLKNASDRLAAFRLKQHRKGQTQLETDLEEISNDFSRLMRKTQDEADKLLDKMAAGSKLKKALMNTATMDDTYWLKEHGISEEEINKALAKHENGTHTDDILAELGIGLNEKERGKLKELLEMLKQIREAAAGESLMRANEALEKIFTDQLDTANKQYQQRKKSLELTLQELEAAKKLYESRGLDTKAIETAISQTKKQLSDNEKTAFGKAAGVWDIFGISREDWENWSDNWMDNLQKITAKVEEWTDTVMGLWDSANSYISQMTEAQTKEIEEQYDRRSAALQKQLDNGIISQKYHDAKLAKMQEEKEKKEKKLKHEQFERERTASIIQSIINGALAISNVWSANAGVPVLAAVLTAITAATTALQTATIAAQPNPYAKGSYIRGPQIALMGEKGDEWVASNMLLRNRETAEVIEALDQYQKGNRKALEAIKFPTPEPKILSHGTPGQMRNFATSNTTNNYYTNAEDTELLAEMRLLRKYLEDPRNRQSVINRNILLQYEKLENAVKETAKL